MAKVLGWFIAAGLVVCATAPGGAAVAASAAPVSTIPVGQFPFHIAASSDGSEMYVANQNDGTVSVIDVATKTVERTITGMGNPVDLAIASDGTLYATQRDAPAVTVVASDSTEATGTLSIGAEATAIGLAPGDANLWVALPTEVVAVDVTSGAVVDTYPGFQNPTDIVVGAGGDVYVTTSTGNTVATISAGAVTQSQQLTTLQNGLTVAGDTAWVSAGPQGGSGTITQVNLSDGSIGWTAAVGELPAAAAADANGNLYVPSVYSGEVTVVAPDGSVVDQIDVGADSGPISVAVSATSVFVVLSASNEVAVFAQHSNGVSDPLTSAPVLAHPVTPAGNYTEDGTPGVNTAMSPELQTKLQERIDAFQAQYNVVGLSAVVITRDPANGEPVTTHFSAGSPKAGSTEKVNPSTQYEIASQTKVYTSDLLAYLVADGRVSLDDTVQTYAPAGIVVPKWTNPDGTDTEITLRDLATHQAGLPDSPQNYYYGCDGHPNCTNPLPYYTQDLLWQNLAAYPLLWKPGTNWLYSNFGFGLLGTILADVIDPTATLTDPPKYEPALRGAFLDDLGMSSTTLGTGPHMATPYLTDTDHTANTETYYWFDTNALAGMGGLVSDANDMAVWDKAHLGDIPKDAPLGVTSMADTLAPQSTITTMCAEPDPSTCTPTENFQMGLGWQLYPASTGMGVAWAFKNGGTTGFSSDTVLARDQGLAATAMWNQGRPLNQNIELAPALLSLIVHFKAEEHRLAATGADAASLLLPAIGAAAWIAGGAAVILIRRRRPSMPDLR
ncbi:serine hydrolase [Herbiconiux daphne]|uniref:Serine hydrolase n=1 Tax=Herbiconiux daphne TaxID=2970914 RepID=A0ABT2GY13_9MICO|nr:serine hydrolase [Herbiconiux daphne]MCS5732848.1 serine hydrolase [Herbiconiux daphne]